jgi:predicted nucleic acid-binding protein
MRFWDTSALVPLLVREAATPWAERLLAEDGEMVVAWTAEMEAISALARRKREGALKDEGHALALKRLQRLKVAWHEVLPSERVRREALRLLQTHPLRTLDALQLASLLVAAEGDPEAFPLVTLDGRLALAASLEGVLVIGPSPSV